jgi:hypothetical protein
MPIIRRRELIAALVLAIAFCVPSTLARAPAEPGKPTGVRCGWMA